MDLRASDTVGKLCKSSGPGGDVLAQGEFDLLASDLSALI